MGKESNFNNIQANKMIGKYIIIGLTINDHEDHFIKRIQYHGIIIEANEKVGIKIALKGIHEGEYYTLPPALETIESAEPGTYKLHSTNEDIENPDYKTSWTITKPKPDWKPGK
jgi:hypothetical protein